MRHPAHRRALWLVLVVALVGCGGGLATAGPAATARGAGEQTGLDALRTDCAQGDATACDLLFVEAPADSDDLDFADTCGGRKEAGTWCAGLPPAGLDDDFVDESLLVRQWWLGRSKEERQATCDRAAAEGLRPVADVIRREWTLGGGVSVRPTVYDVEKVLRGGC